MWLAGEIKIDNDVVIKEISVDANYS